VISTSFKITGLKVISSIFDFIINPMSLSTTSYLSPCFDFEFIDLRTNEKKLFSFNIYLLKTQKISLINYIAIINRIEGLFRFLNAIW
jgi:hypothetical protein